MANGRWRWFGDFENQIATGHSVDLDVLDYLIDLTGNEARLPLKRNVRNTPQIVTL